jgi:hypothetical protein
LQGTKGGKLKDWKGCLIIFASWLHPMKT